MIICPTVIRVWMLYETLTFVLSPQCREFSSHNLSVLFGHMTFMWRMGRHLMSIPYACFQSIQRGYKGQHKLLDSAYRELLWARNAVFFIQCLLGRPWSSCVRAVDACTIGFGIVERQLPMEVVQRHGAWREPWRFKTKVGLVAPRTRALELFANHPTIVDFNSAEMCSDWEVCHEFPEVTQQEVGKEEELRRVRALLYRDVEAMQVLEARSCTWPLRNACGTTQHRDTRLLQCSDNFSAVFALSRGRACDPLLLTQIRKVGAYVHCWCCRCSMALACIRAEPS